MVIGGGTALFVMAIAFASTLVFGIQVCGGVFPTVARNSNLTVKAAARRMRDHYSVLTGNFVIGPLAIGCLLSQIRNTAHRRWY